VIDSLARSSTVRVASIEGLGWGEIAFPADLARAEVLVRGWCQADPGFAGHSQAAE